jgi:hypothetical protein
MDGIRPLTRLLKSERFAQGERKWHQAQAGLLQLYAVESPSFHPRRLARRPGDKSVEGGQMSINALADIAVQRDETAPRRVTSRTRHRRGARREAEPAVTPALEQLPQQGYADALISAIPTEILGLYTFVLTGIVGATDLAKHEQLLARWLLYVAGFVAIGATLVATYQRRKPSARARRFPLAELVAAMVGFAAWGLVMPGSPLMAVLSSAHQKMWTAIIIGAGGLFLYLTTGRLTQPAKK